MGIVGVDLWLCMDAVEPQRMEVQFGFSVWWFSAGNGRRGFAGWMLLVHLVLWRVWRGIGAFFWCYLQYLCVIFCVDWAAWGDPLVHLAFVFTLWDQGWWYGLAVRDWLDVCSKDCVCGTFCVDWAPWDVLLGLTAFGGGMGWQ